MRLTSTKHYANPGQQHQEADHQNLGDRDCHHADVDRHAQDDAVEAEVLAAECGQRRAHTRVYGGRGGRSQETACHHIAAPPGMQASP